MSRVKKRIFGTLLAVLLLLEAALMGGCSQQGAYPPQLTAVPATPPPASEGAVESFVGRPIFVSDTNNLVSEERVLERMAGQTRAEVVIDAMIKGPSSPALTSAIAMNMKVERVELCGEVANIVLSGVMPDEWSWLTTRAAVAKAVSETEQGITCVNVYIYDQEPGFSQKPLGAAATPEVSLDKYLDDYFRQFLDLEQYQDEADSTSERSATLYYLDARDNSGLLVSVVKTLSYRNNISDEELTAQLVRQLMLKQEGGGVVSALPVDASLAAPVTFTDDALSRNSITRLAYDEGIGSRIANICLTQPEGEYDEQRLAAAVTLTVAGFMPEVSGVKLSLKGKDGKIVELNAGKAYTRSQFANMLGHSVTLMYPLSDGSALVPVTRTVPQAAVYDPTILLSELLKGPAAPGVKYPLFTMEDIKEVYISGNVAVVNWNRGFARKLEEYIEYDGTTIPRERREQLFIYGVINTVTNIPGISYVLMLENGKTLQTVGRLYLGNPLMRSTGLNQER